MFSFWGKWRKRASRRGGFTYSHNIISIYHPKWWGPKMKNKPNFLFDNRGWGWLGWGVGGSAAWEFFPHNPVFFLRTSLSPRSLIINLQSSTLGHQLCKCGSHEIWKHCIFLAGMHWETPFLSFSSQKSQYMHFRDKVLDQLRLWGQAASCARLGSSSHLREKYFSGMLTCDSK